MKGDLVGKVTTFALKSYMRSAAESGGVCHLFRRALSPGVSLIYRSANSFSTTPYTCGNIGLVRPFTQPVIFQHCLIALLVEGAQCITTL